MIKLRAYRTRLFVLRQERWPVQLSRGRGWRAQLRMAMDGPTRRREYAREIVLFAKSLRHAESIVDLIFAAACLLTGSPLYIGRTQPVPDDARTAEGLDQAELDSRWKSYVSMGNLPLAVMAAARASWRRNRQYALYKNLVSHYLATIHPMDLDPSHWR